MCVVGMPLTISIPGFFVYRNLYREIRYRRLDSSVSGGGFKGRVRWGIGALKGNNEIIPPAKEVLRVYGDKLSKKDAKVLSWFVYDGYSLNKALHKFFYPHRWRTSLSSEVVVRALMLIGKI